MTKLKVKDEYLKKWDINLFVSEKSEENKCQLKNIIKFLKIIHQQKKLNFTFVSETGGLIPNLSLLENIIIDLPSTKRYKDPIFYINPLIEKKKNPGLLKLFQQIIPDLEQFPLPSNTRETKIVGLIKSLLRPTPFLILERPELFLNKEDIQLFEKIIDCHCKTEASHTIINTSQKGVWEGLASLITTMTPENKFLSILAPANTSQFHHQIQHLLNRAKSDQILAPHEMLDTDFVLVFNNVPQKIDEAA